MQYGREGEMIFDDIYELTYELLNELDFELKPDGTIYDNNSNSILSFNGMIVKASTNPMDIHYAGQGEILFDILHNVRLVTTLLGHYLERKQKEDNLPFQSHFLDEKESTMVEGAVMSNLTVRLRGNFDIVSPYYHNKCLKFIWMIFALDQSPVILDNFDVLEEVQNARS